MASNEAGILAELERLYAEQQKRYRTPFWTVGYDEATQTLTGEVLLERDWMVLEQALQPWWDSLTPQVRILERDAEWQQANTLTDLVTEPTSDAGLATQVLPGEWVRVLASRGRYALVQTEDQAMGWVQNWTASESRQASPWHRLRFEQASALPLSAHGSLQLASRAWLGVPYRLGGRTREGIDCSAYVQQVFEQVFGRLLPRHSWDQKDYGLPVLLEEVQPGDLIFGLSKRGGYKHVGIYLGQDEIIHASRRKQQVVIWKRGLFEMIYQVVVIRRLVGA